MQQQLRPDQAALLRQALCCLIVARTREARDALSKDARREARVDLTNAQHLIGVLDNRKIIVED